MRTFLAALVSLALLASPAFAYTHYFTSGSYRFSIDVRNEHFKDIRDARVNCFVSGATARVEAEAPGYQRGYTTVYLQPNQNDYRVDLRLRDATVFIDCRDFANRPIPGAHYTNFQSLYQGDEYGCTFTVPKQGFQNLTQRDVECRVNHFTPFGARIWFQEGGSAWRIEVVVKRRDMQNLSNWLILYCKSDSDAVTLAAGEKPAALEAKAVLLAAIRSRSGEGQNELLAGQAAQLALELEAALVAAPDPAEVAAAIRAAAPELDAFAGELEAKAAARRLMEGR